MDYINRFLEPVIKETLTRGKSVLLLGARQTGKTTLLSRFEPDMRFNLIQPALRQKYERRPALLGAEVEAFVDQHQKMPLVFLDEVQKVPDLLDVAQDLIDRRKAQFLLTGSSARRLRIGQGINFLPGRVVSLRLDPLIWPEAQAFKPLPSWGLHDFLLYGSLPGILSVPDEQHRELDLASYVTTYLEEEIRSEALVRHVGLFSRFLTLAGAESGQITHYRKISQDIGVAHTTIMGYYQILEDCLVAERVDPWAETAFRRRLIKSPRYLFFDLGVRRLCAEEGIQLPVHHWGRLFEQWVGLELIRHARLTTTPTRVYFWRDNNGVEVDWLLKQGDELTPIEVKWTQEPKKNDIKHLQTFLNEYPAAQKGILICQAPQRMKLANRIEAWPWQELQKIF